MVDEGWQQVRAGLALIQWSRLARWDRERLALIAHKEEEFESAAGHKQVHGEFGRLICWIAFGVGSEYLLKGVCPLKGVDLGRTTKVIRPPFRGEDVTSWARLVRAKDTSVVQDEVSFGTLGTLPVQEILQDGDKKNMALASIELLAKTIRNRDAHRYARNVRSFHFHTVESLFVPALNAVLASLNQHDLGRKLGSDSNFLP